MLINKNISAVSAIKTIARFWSILSLTLILLLFLGEGIQIFNLTLKELTGLILFPIGLSAGFIIAWKKEIIGSVISLVCLALFSIIMGANWFLIMLTIPAVLFLLHAFLLTKR